MTYGFLPLFAFVHTISCQNWFVYVELYYLQLCIIIAYHLNAHIILLRYAICHYIWLMGSQNYELLYYSAWLFWFFKSFCHSLLCAFLNFFENCIFWWFFSTTLFSKMHFLARSFLTKKIAWGKKFLPPIFLLLFFLFVFKLTRSNSLLQIEWHSFKIRLRICDYCS